MSLVVLVTGSRDYTSRVTVTGALEHAWKLDRELTVVEGGARGADRFAGQWAAKRRMAGVGWLRVPAEWDRYPRWEAGPRRNQQMLEWVLQARDELGWQAVVLAFKADFDLSRGTGGTEDMVRRAQRSRLQVQLWR